MNCEYFLEIIDELVEDELDEKTAVRAAGHWPVCPECRAQYEMRQAEKRLYSGFLFNVEPSKNLWAELKEKLDGPAEAQPGEVQVDDGNDWWTRLAAVIKLKPVWALMVVLLIAEAGGIFKLGLLNASDNVWVIQNSGSEISKLQNKDPDIIVTPVSPNGRVQISVPAAVEADPGQKIVRKPFQVLSVKESREKTVFENNNSMRGKMSNRENRSSNQRFPAQTKKTRRCGLRSPDYRDSPTS